MTVYNVICERCGTGFRATRSNADKPPRFCSQACRRTRLETVCIHCGAAFTIKKRDVLESGNCCSKACFYASMRTIPDATCEHCEKVFRPYVNSTHQGRFCSVACYRDWRRALPADERAALMAEATSRIRGSKRELSDLERRARTRQERCALSGDEAEIMAAFDAAGLHPIPLYAVSKYNIDFAFPDLKLAVEYNGGNWHNSLRKRAADVVKGEYLSSKGWNFLVFPRIAKTRTNNSGNERIEIAEIVRRVSEAIHSASPTTGVITSAQFG